MTAWIRAAWVHEFNTDRSVTAGFTVLPGTASPSTVQSGQCARFDVGLKYDVASQTSLFANGSAELSDRGQSIAIPPACIVF
jgi:uncharacterized protein with beta-barrel porin domain